MKIAGLIGVLTLAIFLSCCLHQAEGTFKLLKLVKAGLLLKALSPKKILLPVPIPIPIGISQHNQYHYQSHGHQGYDYYQPHYGYDYGGYGHGGGYGYHSGGYHVGW